MTSEMRSFLFDLQSFSLLLFLAAQ